MPDPPAGKGLHPEHSTLRSLCFPPHRPPRETEARVEGRGTHCNPPPPLQPLSDRFPWRPPLPPAPRAGTLQGAHTALPNAGPELHPRLGGGCTAPRLRPCRLHCGQAQSRGQLMLTPLPLASALLGFKYKYI